MNETRRSGLRRVFYWLSGQCVSTGDRSVKRRWDSCDVQSKSAAGADAVRAGESARSAFATAIGVSGSSSACSGGGATRPRVDACDVFDVRPARPGRAATRGADGGVARAVSDPGRDDRCDSRADGCRACDALASARLSDAAPGRGAAPPCVAPFAGCSDRTIVATLAAAVGCAAAAAESDRVGAGRCAIVDGAARSETTSVVSIARTGAKPADGPRSAINEPMIASAPIVQQVAYSERRSRGVPRVRPACSARPLAAAGTTGASAAADADAAIGPQRHARCGARMSMHDVDSVATQSLPGGAPALPRKVHSRPNGGTSSSGAARG
ncbi:hypothetical protein [Burkholderia dolosa]|uniref:hypothetical protein n=1 Tax=Burkholderia dolosa TaxID=152500 RepID=UPI0027D2263A|nr:hypothetical protein [Burkholderia dolosa]